MKAPVLSLREISLFFFPLVLNVQLMSVSHTIINGALARVDDYVTALAAFSVAMVVHLLVASPSYQNHTITIAIVRGPRSLRGAVVFVLLVASYASVMLALMAYSPAGTFVLNRILGVSGEVAEGARSVLAIFAFLPFFTGFRGFFQGLVIKARRTGLVSFATGVRVGALVFFLFVGRPWFTGAALGAFALLMCIVIETALMGFFAWRFHVKESFEDEKSTGQILRFALPLAFSSGIQQTIPVVIAAIIGRLPDATLALAAFGVIRGLLFLLAGPMRNIQQAYLTLVRNRYDYTVLIKFFLRVGVAMGVLTFLIAYPFNEIVLGSAMGLEDGMRQYISLPLAFCAIYPLFYGVTNLFRGYFTGEHMTGLLGRATLYKFLYLLFCWVGMQLLPVSAPGIAVAIFLLISSEVWEMAYLRLCRKRQPAPSRRLAG